MKIIINKPLCFAGLNEMVPDSLLSVFDEYELEVSLNTDQGDLECSKRSKCFLKEPLQNYSFLRVYCFQ